MVTTSTLRCRIWSNRSVGSAVHSRRLVRQARKDACSDFWLAYAVFTLPRSRNALVLQCHRFLILFVCLYGFS